MDYSAVGSFPSSLKPRGRVGFSNSLVTSFGGGVLGMRFVSGTSQPRYHVRFLKRHLKPKRNQPAILHSTPSPQASTRSGVKEVVGRGLRVRLATLRVRRCG